jgi:hypothetical protein
VVASCTLEVVALSKGSFELALDLPSEQLPLAGSSLGESAIEKVVFGIPVIESDAPGLPEGYDKGVLFSLRDFGRVLVHGVESIDLRLKTRQRQTRVAVTSRTVARLSERIQGPISNLLTIEGRLMMADFKELGTRCRVHKPNGEAVNCTFDESLADTIQEMLRHYVRVSGEARVEPTTGRVASLRIADLEDVEARAEPAMTLTERSFWEPLNLSNLSDEQGVLPVADFADVFGAGSSLWDTETDFETFLEDVAAHRSEVEEN